MPRNPNRKQSERPVSPRRYPFALLALGIVGFFVPQVFSSALFTSGSSNTASVGAAVDWTPPSVTLTYPGDAIRGTVVLNAVASDMETGIKNVVFQRSLSDANVWTTICTDTVAPYTCSFVTTSLAEDYYDLRAIATDNSNYTMESLVEGVLIDNTNPAGSLGAIPSPMSGVVTISATATDAGSGVATVAIQRATVGGTNFTTICTDIDLPYSCRFDSTQVTDGIYDFRAVITDVAGNSFTTAKVTNRVVSNILSSVSVDDPGVFLRGTVTLTANANATLGVANVKIQRQAAGSTTWVDVCTDTATPYSCAFDTTLVANGNYSFRAVLTDTIGQVTNSAVVGPSTVDNTVVRGYDVQTTSGGSAGTLSTGDAIGVAYTRVMNLTTISAGWTGTSKAVFVRLRDGISLGLTGSDDTIDVCATSNCNTLVNLGSVNLKGNYIKNNKTAVFNATMSQTTVTVNGAPATQVTLTLGTIASGGSLRSVSATTNMIWSPSSLATDVGGIPVSTSPTTELGTKDRDW